MRAPATARRFLLFLIADLLSAVAAAAATAAEPIDFNHDIRPIFSDKCFQCHGPDATHRKAGLRLDLEASAKAVLKGHRPIVPGHPEQSTLVERINHSDPDNRMPPPDSGKKLSPEHINLLTRWIAEGAHWSEHWAYVPARRHNLPKTRDSSWPINWIDPFILARLEKETLTPSPEADRITLLRRVSFDLTGLPPSPAELDKLLADTAPGAYERAVDRLLASPAYGERMAVYWLDLVRFADTVGYHGDQEHRISPYRDYVINALNQNIPFDRFTREQLAGDLIPGAALEQTIATGYNRLLQTSHEGGVQAKEYLAIYAADRVRNLSEVWMGGTMGCAQCHDHKFDPYTARDFYAMEAFFADIDEASHLTKGSDSSPTKREPELALYTPNERRQVDRLTTKLTELKQTLDSCSAEEAVALKRQIKATEADLDLVNKNALWTMITVPTQPRPIRILPRGNWLDDSGPIVQPAIPEFLGRLPVDRRATRLDLAKWLTDSSGGKGTLTARVMANRFWFLAFGEGLSRILNDFGGQGEPPSHPELLDNLAVEFVESGWDIKHMMRLLVTSRAYRQSSLVSETLHQRDPENRLLARQARYRLPAEMVRDNALAISGLLVEQVGGRSVKPYQPTGYYRHLNFPKRTYEHDQDTRQWRRGLYVHWQRQFLHPMLKAFDAPRREECTAQRTRSNTPLAALTLLNDPTFVEAARAFAVRILREEGNDARLRYAFGCATSREPNDWERKRLAQIVEDARAEYRSTPDQAKELIHVGQAPLNDDIDPIELAAWTTLARALLNLNETITRN